MTAGMMVNDITSQMSGMIPDMMANYVTSNMSGMIGMII